MGHPNQAPTVIATSRRPGLLRDIFNGMVLGDFAGELGLAGILVRVIMGYIPVVGMICAARDYIADRRTGDRLGAILNFLAFFPVLGGIPKTAEILEHARRVAEARRAIQARSQHGATVASAKQPSHLSTSLALALMAPLLVGLLGIGAVALLVPWLHLQGRAVWIMLLIIGFLMPLLIIVMGHIERYEKARGARTRRSGTLFGLFLGYCYLLVMVVIGAVTLTLR